MAARKSLFPEAQSGDGFRRSRRTLQADLDITPMIDVTFLLLIFFMVTSTMQGNPDVDVPPARHGVGVDAQQSTVIMVKTPDVAGGQPTIVLGDGRGPAGDLDDVREYVERRRGQGYARVIIKGDRDLPHGAVQEVVKVVNAIDGVRFSIGVQDKRTK